MDAFFDGNSVEPTHSLVILNCDFWFQFPDFRHWNQCDQTGRFSKVLGTKITYKVTQTLGDFLAFLKDNLKVKTAGTTLMGNIFSKIGLLFNLTSGHTETNGNNH